MSRNTYGWSRTAIVGLGVVLGAAAVDVLQHYAFECRVSQSLVFGGLFGLAIMGWPGGMFLIARSDRLGKNAKILLALALSVVGLVVAATAGFFTFLTHMCP
jgi:hypothetical protein